MSECVVRMEMPENCTCCPMCFTADVQGYHWCAALEQEVEEGLSRPKECPIICSLPEGHGRLVDEKEVKDWVENWLCVNKYYHPYSSSKSIPVSDLYDVLQRMDASVPAERSNHEAD